MPGDEAYPEGHNVGNPFNKGDLPMFIYTGNEVVNVAKSREDGRIEYVWERHDESDKFLGKLPSSDHCLLLYLDLGPE